MLTFKERIIRAKSGDKRNLDIIRKHFTEYCMTLSDPGAAYLLIENAIKSYDPGKNDDPEGYIKYYLRRGLYYDRLDEIKASKKTTDISAAYDIVGDPGAVDDVVYILEGGNLTYNEKVYLQGKLRNELPNEIRQKMIFKTYSYITEYEQIEKSCIEKCKKYLHIRNKSDF